MKLLYVTSLSGVRINGFMRSAIVAAKSLGIEFTMACNMDDADIIIYVYCGDASDGIVPMLFQDNCPLVIIFLCVRRNPVLQD